ncbi:hypothetical protein [Streptomyces sp. TR02-1]|uniref:hypothetical protein n=1 Tax=Streptomyces sp. TR02-1 TaxID=3385977 RepID=UPI0039A31321
MQLVDPEPTEQGNTVALLDGTGTWRSRVPTKERPADPWEKPVMPHVATCRVRTRRERRTPHSSSLPPGVVSLAERRRSHTIEHDEQDKDPA